MIAVKENCPCVYSQYTITVSQAIKLARNPITHKPLRIHRRCSQLIERTFTVFFPHVAADIASRGQIFRVANLKNNVAIRRRIYIEEQRRSDAASITQPDKEVRALRPIH